MFYYVLLLSFLCFVDLMLIIYFCMKVSQHDSYIPSEDPTNVPVEAKVLPVPAKTEEEEEEDQNFFTKHIYSSTGRRKRAKKTLITLWDTLFDTDEEKREKAAARERINLEALAVRLASSELDSEDPAPKDDDDLEFKMNSWYPMVLVVGAAAVMLNGNI
jgi:hypothetical protein